jgi:hypothetical protein
MAGYAARPPIDRIMEQIEPLPWCGCWIYMGSIKKNGYGQIETKHQVDGTRQTLYVHRVVYEARLGPIPDGLELDHVKARGCVSRACCNPDHLEPVTRRVNILRGDGISAQRARQTQCIHGHALAGDNLARVAYGRICKICRLNRQRSRVRTPEQVLARAQYAREWYLRKKQRIAEGA